MAKYLRDIEKTLLTKRPDVKKALDERRPRARLVEALLGLRQYAHLSQRQLAEKVDTKQNAIARMERVNNDRIQTTEKIIEYARGCGVEVAIIFYEKENGDVHLLEAPSLTSDDDILSLLNLISDGDSDDPKPSNKVKVA